MNGPAATTGPGAAGAPGPGPRRTRLRAPSLLAALVLAAAGCAGPPPAPTSTPRPARPAEGGTADTPVPPNPDAVARSIEAVRAGTPGGVEVFNLLAFDRAETPGDRRRLVDGIRGFELPVLADALERAAKEARDVGPVLRDLAAAVGCSGTDADRLGVVREISGRECCLRRGFLAAALDGLADGLEAAATRPGPQAEAALRLLELAGNHDPGVAAAARRAALLYPVPTR